MIGQCRWRTRTGARATDWARSKAAALEQPILARERLRPSRAHCDDSELATLLFSKGEPREKGDVLLRHWDCFVEVGVAHPNATAPILQELIHRRKHVAPGGITLLMGRHSLSTRSEKLCAASPNLAHTMHELLPSLIGDRCFYLGEGNAVREAAGER